MVDFFPRKLMFTLVDKMKIFEVKLYHNSKIAKSSFLSTIYGYLWQLIFVKSKNRKWNWK